MKTMPRLSLTDQTANHLRQGIRESRWGGRFPGVPAIVKECEVSINVARAAVRLLEADGWVTPGGHGRRRSITRDVGGSGPSRVLRVGILLREPRARLEPGFQEALQSIIHRAENAGHNCFFAQKTQLDLQDRVDRVARHVRTVEADAWMVVDGQRRVLEWFAAQPRPVLALGGGCKGLEMAAVGPDVDAKFLDITRRLLDLGHRRIVILSPENTRMPVCSELFQKMLDEINRRGVQTSTFNLPDWEETPEGLRALLDSLFRVTPPTALIVTQPMWTHGVLSFASSRSIQIPGQLSLFAYGIEHLLPWHIPTISHMVADDLPVVKRALDWIRNIAKGHEDRRNVTYPARNVEGGTLAPPPRRAG